VSDLVSIDETDLHDLPGCAWLLRECGHEPAGTATRMRSWLLIEQPGPWAADTLERLLRAALPAERHAQLAQLRAARALRPLLIRRPGRAARDRHGHTVMVGGSAPGHHWLEELRVDDLARLAELDLGAVARGPAGLGRPVDEPVFLVCTHGAKDMCCAVHGRPVAARLARSHPSRVWETSHVGGDRWAANLLVVPDGFLHGQVGPADAERIAAAALAGEVDLARLRGRTRATPWAQAAEIAVRHKTGLRGLDEVLAVDVEHDGGEAVRRVVTVQAGGERFAAHVRREPLAACGVSRCAGVLRPSTFVVERLES
jgi:hypothetical protein